MIVWVFMLLGFLAQTCNGIWIPQHVCGEAFKQKVEDNLKNCAGTSMDPTDSGDGGTIQPTITNVANIQLDAKVTEGTTEGKTKVITITVSGNATITTGCPGYSDSVHSAQVSAVYGLEVNDHTLTCKQHKDKTSVVLNEVKKPKSLLGGLLTSVVDLVVKVVKPLLSFTLRGAFRGVESAINGLLSSVRKFQIGGKEVMCQVDNLRNNNGILSLGMSLVYNGETVKLGIDDLTPVLGSGDGSALVLPNNAMSLLLSIPQVNTKLTLTEDMWGSVKPHFPGVTGSITLAVSLKGKPGCTTSETGVTVNFSGEATITDKAGKEILTADLNIRTNAVISSGWNGIGFDLEVKAAVKATITHSDPGGCPCENKDKVAVDIEAMISLGVEKAMDNLNCHLHRVPMPHPLPHPPSQDNNMYPCTPKPDKYVRCNVPRKHI